MLDLEKQMKTNKVKVVILAPVHSWDDVRIFKKQAISLAKEKFQVTIIARADSIMQYDNITILPVKAKYTKRLQRFLSLPRIALQALQLNADIYHLHNPDTIPIVWFLRLCRKQVIYDTHEDFSERLLMREWIPKVLRYPAAKFVHFLECMTAKISSATIATQPDLVKKLGDKCTLIGNPPRIDNQLYDLVNTLSKTIVRSNELRLVYIGGINKFRGLFEMVEALDILNNIKNIPCRLWLIGPSNLEDINVAKELKGWKYVDYLMAMPQEQAFAYVCKADIGMVYINDIGDHRKADANKIYEYMSFSIPFIASDFPIWRQKLQSINAGLFVPTESSVLLAKTIQKFYEMPLHEKINMGINGKIYTQNYNWEKEYSKLQSIYFTILDIESDE